MITMFVLVSLQVYIKALSTVSTSMIKAAKDKSMGFGWILIYGAFDNSTLQHIFGHTIEQSSDRFFS